MSHDALWWRVAWRNLWRNSHRTWITASGLAFGYFSSVILIGLTDGMSAELVDNGTRLMVGQVQIHAAEYLPERNMHHTIGGYDGTDVDRLVADVEAHPDVEHATPRLFGGGLLSSGEQTTAALLLGVDPERELRVSTLLGTLTAGRLPTADDFEVLVGSEMARQLEVGVGDELVIVAPAADGSMGNDLYTVAGIFETGTPGIDANYAILPLEDLQYLMAMGPDRVHEVVTTVTRARETPAIAASLGASLDGNGLALDVKSWVELRPELSEAVALMDSMNFVIVIIIFAMAIFGVANTMLIGTFERRREFAVIRALGTTRGSVSRTVVYEGIILAGIALTIGALVTWPVMVWWHNTPPDLSTWFSGFEWTGVQWRPILRVEYSTDAPVFTGLALFFTAVFAALYPAWRATRVPPADALADR
jgi:ABC-type lipoprotein release transport system permease subunit